MSPHAPPEHLAGRAWGPESCFDLLGTTFGVHCDSAALAASVNRLLSPFRRAAVDVPDRRRYSILTLGKDGGHALYRGGEELLAGARGPTAVGALLAELNAEAVAGYGGFAVHAGVVAAGGRVVAFPAASGSGKSTLTAACLAAGFDYVSDEALCLDYGSASVVPYLKPLALSGWSRRAVGLEGDPDDGEETLVLAEDLGSRHATGPLRLAHVVLIERGAGPPVLRDLARSEVITALLHFSFNHYKNPGEAFRLVSELAGAGRAWRVTYEHPIPAARLLRDRLGGDAPAAAPQS